MREAFVGFDSAWSGRNKGGLAWASFDGNTIECHGPQPADFKKALSDIQCIAREHDYLLVAIDQPTIVPNPAGSRPVDGVARSLIQRRLHSGVQPASRKKEALFGDDAPIWKFLARLQDGPRETGEPFRQNPHAARTEPTGKFLIEVYPALTLPAWLPVTLTRAMPPKGNGSEKSSGSRPKGYAARYNPRGKTFAPEDWKMVGGAVADRCDRFGLSDLSAWIRKVIEEDSKPKKVEQDQMDAVICLLIALMWRRDDAERLALLGDRQSGYMATPVSEETREILAEGARDGRFSCPPERWDSDADRVRR